MPLIVLFFAAVIFVGLGLIWDTPRPHEPDTQTILAQPAKNEGREITTQSPDEYIVEKVVDGDTIVVERGGERVTVRLIGIDAPEATALRKGAAECFGNEATTHARALLEGARVTLKTDPSQDTHDRYGRLLAYVFIRNCAENPAACCGDECARSDVVSAEPIPHLQARPDTSQLAARSGFIGEENTNVRMIEDGFAHEYTYRLPYEYQKEFKEAEAAAHGARRGLWAPDACEKYKGPSFIIPATTSSGLPLAEYDCTKNTYNCSSFKTHDEAQATFEICGGSETDVHKLDSDKDGKVCESLP